MKEVLTISLQLASFDKLRTPGFSDTTSCKGLLFFGVGADTRAQQQAFKFLLLGIHQDEVSATRFIDHNKEISPWLNECNEIWTAVLQPFHHKGEANYLNTNTPGKLFEVLAESPGTNTPIVVLTTSGWVTGDNLDMNRVKEFSEGVLGVRASMTAVTGLHSQQSFFPRRFDLRSHYCNNMEGCSCRW